MDRIENTLRAEVDDLKAQSRDTALKRTAAEKAGDTQKAKLLAKRADDQSMKAGKAERDLNFWVKEGAPEDWVFQGKGAETTVQLFRKTGQLPAWNVWGNKVLRQYPVMRQWSEAVERLAGTNGAMLPDPSRPAVDSVVGGQHMWNQKFEVFHAKMRDIYGELHGMEQGALTPAKLRMRRTYQWASRRWKTARNQEATGPMSWDEFQYTVQQATIDNVELGQTHPNPIIQRAVATTIEYGQELEAAAKNANVFASAQSIQRNLDEANNALENISPELRKHELAFRKEIDKLDETQMLQRYKETATSQQKLREAGKEDGDEWDRNGIELAVLRHRIDGIAWEKYQEFKAKAGDFSSEELEQLKEIQDKWRRLASGSEMYDSGGQKGYMSAEDVNEKFFEMEPLIDKLPDEILIDWATDKRNKLRIIDNWNENDGLGDNKHKWTKIRPMIEKEYKFIGRALERKGITNKMEVIDDTRMPASEDELEKAKKEMLSAKHDVDRHRWSVNPSKEMNAQQKAKFARLRGAFAEKQQILIELREQGSPSLSITYIKDDGVEVKPKAEADTEPQPVERVWTSTKHLEVDPPSLLNERLNRKLADLEDRLKQARADGFSQHLTRRFDTAKIDARIEDFKEILRKYFTDHPERYAGDKNPRSTDPADIEKRVNETIQRIHGENVYDDIAGQMNFDEAGRPLSNGALSRRRLDIPSHLVRDFLEPFQIDVMATATKKIGGAIEMVRATGDQSGENLIQDLIDKSLAQGVPAETVEEMAGELRALRDSALGIDGLGVDPTRWDTRALRMARWINVAAFMGRVPQVMTIDLGYAVHIAGFKKLLQATNLNTMGLSTRMGEILKKDAGLWLAGTEVNQASRSASIFNDPVGSVQAKTPVERAAQGAADNVFFYTGASWFTDWIRRQSGLLTSHEVLRLSDKVVDGTISNADKARLRSFGIDDQVAKDINKEWKRIPAEDRVYQAQFGSGEINMANATEWEDQTLASFFASKIRMELDNIVPQMNAGTRPKIMKSEWGRALMLYSSIGVHMTQTVNMRMMQRGPRNAIAAATSMILAGYLVENMRKPDYISDDPEDAFYGAVMISGVGGFPFDGFDRLSQVTGSSLGLQVMGIDPPPWSDQFNPGRINPITSQLGDFGMSLLPGMEWNDRLRAWKYMFAYNNMWQWKSTYDLPNEIREWASE